VKRNAAPKKTRLVHRNSALRSPEQFALRTDENRHAFDLYSLGVTFWYLLSGRVPFVGRTLTTFAKASGVLTNWQLKVGECSGADLALLKSMLAPDPKDRPQSARELLSAVHPLHKIQHEAPCAAQAIRLAAASAAFVSPRAQSEPG